ncbi:MAG: LD-carboxypeptidase [Acidobacteriota bacterium]
MKRPRRLTAGDRVALVAPASPFRREDLEAGVAELMRLGFEPVVDDRIFLTDRYVAGPSETRAAVIHGAWRDPSIRALVAVRGGYGSAQVLPHLDPSLLVADPKIFLGYSDATALLWYHLRHGVVAFHGPMVEGRLARGEAGYHRPSLLAALTEAGPAGELAPDGLDVFAHGEAAGSLVGGTITQLGASLGTPFACDPPPGAVLFLEDVNERPYRVDRLFTQLRQAGVLARAAGLVLGAFPNCDEPGGQPAIRDVLRDLTREMPGPVLFGFPSGHTPAPAWTLPFGVRARIVTRPRPRLIIEEAAVS